MVGRGCRVSTGPVRRVIVIGHACLVPATPGEAVPDFDPVAGGIPRKSLKTMTRAVQLGVVAALRAMSTVPGWQAVPPERRGLFVGASPQQGDIEDLAAAIEACGPIPSLAALADHGVPLVPPLWLVKGLSNNVLGYASAMLDFRGDNGNWCDGRLGGAVAVCNAVHAVAEGRADLALAGGADALRGAEAILGRTCGEGAAFLVLVGEGVLPGTGVPIEAGLPSAVEEVDPIGELAAAALPVALVRALMARRSLALGGLRLNPTVS